MKMKLPTKARWIGLIVMWTAYNLGILVMYLLYLHYQTWNILVGGTMFLQMYVAIVAICALWRPRFTEPKAATSMNQQAA